MRTKLLAFLAGAVFSMSASAGYIKYDFNGPISGSFVVHDDDLTIAAYRFYVPLEGPYPFQFNFAPMGGDGVDTLTAASTRFRTAGPTNFSIYDNYGGDRVMGFNIDFAQGSGGAYAYQASYTGKILFFTENGFEYLPYSGSLTGNVTQGTIDPALAAYLDSQGGYDDLVPRIVPTYVGPPQAVPEPGSLALFAAAALGAARVLRRRKTTR